MKKLIFLFLMVAGLANAQQEREFEWLDSLTANRTSILVDVSGFPFVDVALKGLTTSDTLIGANMLDSMSGNLNTKFTRDTVLSSFRLLRFNDGETPFATIKGLSSVSATSGTTRVSIMDNNLNKFYLKWTDTVFGHTIYVRIRGVIY